MINIVTFREEGIEYVSHGINIDTLENVCLPQERLTIVIREWKLVNYEGLGWCL